jgi:pimeloyl-ACP methyl ester carboxylesterase
MRLVTCFCLFLLIPACLTAQTTTLDSLCQVFRLPTGKDTITFVVFGTKADLKQRKPLFLFRQGSRPHPIIDYDKGRYYMGGPFRFRTYKADYHFVMVSKPGVRLIADSTFLAGYEAAMKTGDPSGTYISPTYQANNYRQRYVADCDRVINFLVKQPFIDPRKVVYCGGSEGFTVGADLVANHNRYVTHTILFSGHTGRRFENWIYPVRKQMREGKLSPEEAQKTIDAAYQAWADILKAPTSTARPFGDTNRAWVSFSEPTLPNLLKINTPLYIAYGTADEEIAISLDYLPLDFIEKGKTNLTLRAYPDHDHQFMHLKRDAAGTIISQEYNGDAVAHDWFEWLKTTK